MKQSGNGTWKATGIRFYISEVELMEKNWDLQMKIVHLFLKLFVSLFREFSHEYNFKK